MTNFQRTGSSKESLDIGLAAKNKKKWKEGMKPHWASILPEWIESQFGKHAYGKMDFAEGIYNIHRIDYEQKEHFISSFTLDELIFQLKERKNEEFDEASYAQAMNSGFN